MTIREFFLAQQIHENYHHHFFILLKIYFLNYYYLLKLHSKQQKTIIIIIMIAAKSSSRGRNAPLHHITHNTRNEPHPRGSSAAEKMVQIFLNIEFSITFTISNPCAAFVVITCLAIMPP